MHHGGAATFTFANDISRKGRRNRPDAGQQSRHESFTVECIVPVTINIHPAASRTRSTSSQRRGPVRVLTTAPGHYGLRWHSTPRGSSPLTTRFGRSGGHRRRWSARVTRRATSRTRSSAPTSARRTATATWSCTSTPSSPSWRRVGPRPASGDGSAEQLRLPGLRLDHDPALSEISPPPRVW